MLSSNINQEVQPKKYKTCHCGQVFFSSVIPKEPEMEQTSCFSVRSGALVCCWGVHWVLQRIRCALAESLGDMSMEVRQTLSVLSAQATAPAPQPSWKGCRGDGSGSCSCPLERVRGPGGGTFSPPAGSRVLSSPPGPAPLLAGIMEGGSHCLTAGHKKLLPCLEELRRIQNLLPHMSQRFRGLSWRKAGWSAPGESSTITLLIAPCQGLAP